jgi:hypothetical protein
LPGPDGFGCPGFASSPVGRRRDRPGGHVKDEIVDAVRDDVAVFDVEALVEVLTTDSQEPATS